MHVSAISSGTWEDNQRTLMRLHEMNEAQNYCRSCWGCCVSCMHWWSCVIPDRILLS